MSFIPPITCHVLDTTSGKPASEVHCEITHLPTSSTPFAQSYTNSDGRVPEWLPVQASAASALGFAKDSPGGNAPRPGTYVIRFHTKEYFGRRGEGNSGKTFFPFVDITFEVPQDSDKHYHVPLLLSNYGYSTYRGS